MRNAYLLVNDILYLLFFTRGNEENNTDIYSALRRFFHHVLSMDNKNGSSLLCRFIGLDNTSVTVEELALQFYMLPERGGWMGCHSENGIWHILFGLVMWDVIFSGLFTGTPTGRFNACFLHILNDVTKKQTLLDQSFGGFLCTESMAQHQHTVQGVCFCFKRNTLFLCRCRGCFSYPISKQPLGPEH